MSLIKLKVAVTVAVKVVRLIVGLKDLKLDGKLTDDELIILVTQLNKEVLPVFGIKESDIERLEGAVRLYSLAKTLPFENVKAPDWLTESPLDRLREKHD